MSAGWQHVHVGYTPSLLVSWGCIGRLLVGGDGLAALSALLAVSCTLFCLLLLSVRLLLLMLLLLLSCCLYDSCIEALLRLVILRSDMSQTRQHIGLLCEAAWYGGSARSLERCCVGS